MWTELSKPWQACLELAWEAYCDDCIPIGAVVTGPDGEILSHGRNRIYEKVKPGGVNGAALAHAETEALQGLDLDRVDAHRCTLYTTTEPCPMCMGTFYMSGLRTLHYAARDPYAGSTNLLGTTWYLSQKPIEISGPDTRLETIVVALFTEQDAHFHNDQFPAGVFWEMYAKTLPEGIGLGQRLYEQGELKTLRENCVAACDIYDRLALLVE
jgi:tRNA(adenine34) deaminase